MRTKIRLGIGFVFFMGLVLMHMYGGFDQFTIDNLRACGDRCMVLVKEQYIISVLTYHLAYIAAIVFALPIATIMTLASGYLFGTVWGAIFAIIAATAGSLSSFIIVRYCLGDVIQEKYAAQLQKFNAAIAEHGMNYLLIIRLIPLIPFFLVNILSAMTVISLPAFVGITFIGIIPSKCIFAFAGEQLHYIESMYDVFSVRIIGVFALFALLASSPILLRALQKRRIKSV